MVKFQHKLRSKLYTRAGYRVREEADIAILNQLYAMLDFHDHVVLDFVYNKIKE